MTVWVVFASVDDKREYAEDIICTSREELRAHMADLRQMDFEPTYKEYANEGDYYMAKTRFENNQ